MRHASQNYLVPSCGQCELSTLEYDRTFAAFTCAADFDLQSHSESELNSFREAYSVLMPEFGAVPFTLEFARTVAYYRNAELINEVSREESCPCYWEKTYTCQVLPNRNQHTPGV